MASMLQVLATRVVDGATIQFRPTGGSMAPLIRSRQLVTVAPVDPARLEVGDIVLAKVAGHVYLHLVSALDPGRGRVQISNNRGRVNGWTSRDRVYGICVAVEGQPRPGAAVKVRAVSADEGGTGGSADGAGGSAPSGERGTGPAKATGG